MSDRARLIEAIRSELERAVGSETLVLARLPEIVGDRAIELADVLDDFDDKDILRIFDSLAESQQLTVLEEAGERTQELLVRHLKTGGRLPEFFREMAIDDVVDIVDERPEAEREELLEGLDSHRAEQIRELSQYSPDTAGGLMTAEFLAVSKSTTVGEVKELIRDHADFESINNIFVTDAGKLIGVFSVRQLLIADNNDRVEDFMTTDVLTVDVDDDPEEVYRIMETYHLTSMPVVDEFHNLVGIITVDDVLTVGEREASEDVFRIAGSVDVRPTKDTIMGRVKKRLPFLMLSLLGGFGTANVLKLFGAGPEAIITKASYFTPLIVSLCGNIATQSSATMVRGFATGEIDGSRLFRVILDEIGVGFIVGSVCAVISASLAWILRDDDPIRMAAVVFSSVVCLSFVASTLGAGVPTLFHRLQIDPAIAAGPLITVLVDMTGSLIYLSFVVWYHAG